MEPTVKQKVHKCKHRNKDVCEKACIREHNRLVKLNHQYDKMRTMIGISSKTSKAKTLVEVTQYIKMLTYVLNATDGSGENERLNESNETEPLETAEELEQKYTLNEDFRAILPNEMQTLSIPELEKEMPYIMKLFALTRKASTSDDTDDECNVPENGPSTSSCKPMPLGVDCTVDEYSEQPMEVDEVIEQPPEDQTNVAPIQIPPSYSTNSEKFLIKNLVDVEILPTMSDQSDCLPLANVVEDVETQLYSCASLQDNIETSPLLKDVEFVEMVLPSFDGLVYGIDPIADPSPDVAHEPEPMEGDDYSLTAELERNLGEVCDEWLSWDLLDNEAFYNDQDRLIYMDTDSVEANDMEDLQVFTSL